MLALSPFEILIIALATWRIASMVTLEDGPFDVFKQLRTTMPLGGLLECIKCCSVWVAAGLFLVWATSLQPLVYILAISGAALMLASFTGVHHL